ncbi:DUF6247 family protein [Streptomyces sp. wa53]|uniref:DUF6247 family protein n=1 Tax=Streptomyces sp. wa53 TaxID=1828268 RepID=UPI003C7EC3D1
MSAQPEEAPAPPAPAAAARLLAQLRADRRAQTWVPAFERDWAKALEDSRHTYSLTPLHDVVRTWQLRVAAGPGRRRVHRLRPRRDRLRGPGRRPRGPPVTAQPWAVRLSPLAAKTLAELHEAGREMARDVLDIAVRSPWSWPQWNIEDPEGEDVRAAAIGQLSVVYVINQLTRHLADGHHLAWVAHPAGRGPRPPVHHARSVSGPLKTNGQRLPARAGLNHGAGARVTVVRCSSLPRAAPGPRSRRQK